MIFPCSIVQAVPREVSVVVSLVVSPRRAPHSHQVRRAAVVVASGAVRRAVASELAVASTERLQVADVAAAVVLEVRRAAADRLVLLLDAPSPRLAEAAASADLCGALCTLFLYR